VRFLTRQRNITQQPQHCATTLHAAGGFAGAIGLRRERTLNESISIAARDRHQRFFGPRRSEVVPKRPHQNGHGFAAPEATDRLYDAGDQFPARQSKQNLEDVVGLPGCQRQRGFSLNCFLGQPNYRIVSDNGTPEIFNQDFLLSKPTQRADRPTPRLRHAAWRRLEDESSERLNGARAARNEVCRRVFTVNQRIEALHQLADSTSRR
jgi:hypothetical protein